MIQGALWDVMVVGGQVLGESGVEIGDAEIVAFAQSHTTRVGNL